MLLATELIGVSSMRAPMALGSASVVLAPSTPGTIDAWHKIIQTMELGC